MLDPLVLLHGDAGNVDAITARMITGIGAHLGAMDLLDVRVETAHEAVRLLTAIALEGPLAALVNLANVRLQREGVCKAVSTLLAFVTVLGAFAAARMRRRTNCSSRRGLVLFRLGVEGIGRRRLHLSGCQLLRLGILCTCLQCCFLVDNLECGSF